MMWAREKEAWSGKRRYDGTVINAIEWVKLDKMSSYAAELDYNSRN